MDEQKPVDEQTIQESEQKPTKYWIKANKNDNQLLGRIGVIVGPYDPNGGMFIDCEMPKEIEVIMNRQWKSKWSWGVMPEEEVEKPISLLGSIIGKGSKDLLAEALRSLQNWAENMEQIAEIQLISAKLSRSKYEALIKAGYTEVQAMEIVKAQPNNSVIF